MIRCGRTGRWLAGEAGRSRQRGEGPGCRSPGSSRRPGPMPASLGDMLPRRSGLPGAFAALRCCVTRMGALDAESGEDKPSLNLSHAAPPKSHDLPEQILLMELEDITDLLGRVKGRFVGAGQRIKGIQGQNGLKAVDRAVRRNRMRAVRVTCWRFAHGLPDFLEPCAVSIGQGRRRSCCVPTLPSAPRSVAPSFGNIWFPAVNAALISRNVLSADRMLPSSPTAAHDHPPDGQLTNLPAVKGYRARNWPGSQRTAATVTACARGPRRREVPLLAVRWQARLPVVDRNDAGATS